MRNYVKTSTVYQMECTECGAASLAMIFAYHGKYVSLEKMRVETGVSRDGCTAKNIVRAAKKYGFEVHAYRKEVNDLLELEMPCIIHWNFDHFMVLEGRKGKYIYVNDPAQGRRRLTFEEFDSKFTGIVLTFKPSDDFKKEKEKKSVLKFIINKTTSDRNTMLLIFCISLLSVFPNLVIPVLSQYFIDSILIVHNYSYFNLFILFLMGMIIIQLIIYVYKSFVLADFQNKLTLCSTYEFLYKMFRLPISFFEQRYPGEISNRVKNNENVCEMVSGDLVELFLNLILIIFYFSLLLIYNYVLAIIGLVVVMFNLIVMKLTNDRIGEESLKIQQDSGNMIGAVSAGLRITSTIKASGAESRYVGRILGFYAQYFSNDQHLNKTQEIMNSLPGTIKKVSDLIILILGGYFVIEGTMTIGMLIAFTSLYSSFYSPVEKVVNFVKQLQIIKASISRIEDINDYEVDEKYIKEIKKDFLCSKLEGDVECKDITFGYNELNPAIISNISFKVNCGESIAFVGGSGCGKSTLSKIMSGLYSPWGGEIYFDGKNSKTISSDIINASVSTVSQNVQLFSGTIRDNLKMWNEKITDTDMILAAKDACIHDVITQKKGAYDYMLLEGAKNLSGGQRQRLEIARALTTNPTILILDEATSALDPIVEKKILDNIKRRGCTCIVVAHRLSAIRDCDQIIVLEKGHIVEKGKHKDLIKSNGLYKKFVQNL